MLALISFILLGKDLTGLKPMQEYNFLFTKKRETFIISDLMLLPVNLARDI